LPKDYDIEIPDSPKINPRGLKVQKKQSVEKEFTHQSNAIEFRKKLINRLEYNGIKSRPNDNYTIFIFDWDDTFLCTSFLNQKTKNTNYKQFMDSLNNYLVEISAIVIKVLEKALNNGKV